MVLDTVRHANAINNNPDALTSIERKNERDSFLHTTATNRKLQQSSLPENGS